LGFILAMKYKDELIKSMNFLAEDPRTIFIGQSVRYSGNAIYNTLEQIDENKKIELPVFEDVQMGMSIGLALNGFIPISCYPRFDFLILACNQLVNHLDKIEFMSKGKMRPRVIIRTSIGPKEPLDGGPQHTADYTESIKKMLTEVKVVSLIEPSEIFPEFKKALLNEDSRCTLLIENGAFYNDK
jgi:pyruvate/2-oxoglutarate/acetoin dehydrogenase E1 component